MHRYAALLRGIGPGNPNMRNDKLRGVFEGLGLESRYGKHITTRTWLTVQRILKKLAS